jgi:asparagine N-glycosylation enzyme membrane subunit Stt3
MQQLETEVQASGAPRPGWIWMGVPSVTAVLAVAAGAIHLAHNYLPMQAPPAGSGGSPADIASTAGGPGGLMGLLMPHLTQVMVLNFVAFAGLAIVLVAIAQPRPSLRVVTDVLLAVLCVATLYAWTSMGRANPYGTGTLALVVEIVLIPVALTDAVFVALQSRRAQVRAVTA